MSSVFTCEEEGLEGEKDRIDGLLAEVRRKYGKIWVLEARAVGCLLYFYKKKGDEQKYNELKRGCFELLEQKKNVLFEQDDRGIFIFMLSDYCKVWQMGEGGGRVTRKISFGV